MQAVRECYGDCVIELAHTNRGHECRLYYMGELKYTTVHTTEPEGRQRYDECCQRWQTSAERVRNERRE